MFEPLGLVQLVEFETWRRIVNGTLRTSILDHVYTDDMTIIEDLTPIETIVGDHSLITMKLRNTIKDPPIITYRRNWSKYSKAKLIEELSSQNCNMQWQMEDVQSNWNKIEEVLIKVSDIVAPISEFKNNVSSRSQEIPIYI